MLLLVSCTRTRNHLLYFGRFCVGSTPKNFARFPNHFSSINYIRLHVRWKNDIVKCTRVIVWGWYPTSRIVSVAKCPTIAQGWQAHTELTDTLITCLMSLLKLSSLRCQCLQCHFAMRALVVSAERGGDAFTWAIMVCAERKGRVFNRFGDK